MKDTFQYGVLIVLQIVLAVLFFIFADYGGAKDSDTRGTYEDTHVMIFIGFGFLMTFLKRYGYSALGFNLLLASLAIQWALLCQNFYHMENNTIFITKKMLLEADIMSATVLITYGALLGLVSGPQLIFITFVEVAVACANMYLVLDVFKAADVGGSICIHTFGAYFGLGVSAALRLFNTESAPNTPASPNLGRPSYSSDITAMIGTIFLWIYWPSFNSGLTATDAEYQRATINTYLGLAAATVTAFAVSSMVNHEKGKFDMVHIQNSTLAGGVAVGAVCNMFISPGIAILLGMGAGAFSVLGYRYLTPLMAKLGVQDTCGVNNLHGMPGIYSGIFSIIFAAMATSERYGSELATIFPEMVDAQNPRSAGEQSLYQLYSVGVSIILPLVSGYITGHIVKFIKPLQEDERYDDGKNWAELP